MHAPLFLDINIDSNLTLERVQSLKIDTTSTQGKEIKGWSDERPELTDVKITEEDNSEYLPIPL